MSIAVLGKVQYYLWQCLLSATLLLSLNVSQSSQEPVVKIRFYDFWVFRINVKEYVAISGAKNNFMIGCDVENIPIGTDGTISLRNRGNVLRNSSLLGSISLVWTGMLPDTDFSILSCDVNVGNGKLRANVSLSDVKVFHNADGCLPNSKNDKFLSNEIITIYCVSSSNPEWYSETDEALKATSEVGGRVYRDSRQDETRFVRNYVNLTDQLNGNLTCRSRSNNTVVYCYINTQNLTREKKLAITISPQNFDMEQVSNNLTFTCYTNLTTEYIKWRAKTRNGHNILDIFNFDVETELMFSIGHSLKSSQLRIFSDRLIDLASVSCSTDRAGFVAQSVATNDQNSNSTSLTYIVIITVTTSLLFVISSSAFMAYVIIKQRKAHQDARVTVNETTTEPEYHYATDWRADGDTYEINIQDVGRGDSLHDKRADGPRLLSAAILEEGAVITANDIYQSSET